MHHAESRLGGALPARPGHVLALALIAALVGSACQAAAPPSPATMPTPTAAPPTPSAAPSPSPASTGIAAAEVAGSAGELNPARYTHRGFEPRITFELAGPWRSVNASRGFFDVQQDAGSPDVIAVQFGLPDQVYAAPDRPTAVATAEAAATTLSRNARLVTLESSSSQIGGLTGFQITVENPANGVGDAQVMHVAPGVVGISPGRRLWCAFFDTPNGLLAILIGGSVAKWDEALAAAEPVLESLTIGK